MLGPTSWYLFLFCLGLALVQGFGESLSWAMRLASAFPLGLALYGAVAWLFAMLGVSFTPASILASLASCFVGLLALIGARQRLSAPAFLRAATGVGAFTTLAFVFSTVDLAILSTDSYIMVYLGKFIARAAGIGAAASLELRSWGLLPVMSHASASLVGESMLFGLAPLLSVTSWAALLAAGIALAAPSTRAGLVQIVFAWLLAITAYTVVFHSFFVHSNLMAMSYFGLGVAFTCLAEINDDRRIRILAMLCWCALALARVETVLLVAIAGCIASACWATRLSDRVLLWVVPVLAWAAWVVRLQLLAPRDGPASAEFALLSPARSAVMLVGLSGYGALVVGHRALPWLRQHIHRGAWAPSSFLVAAILVAGLLKPVELAMSLRATAYNAFAKGYWSLAWIGFGGLWLLHRKWLSTSLASATQRFFVCNLFAGASLIVFLGCLRSPYRIGLGDSGHRMMLHLLPLVFFATAGLLVREPESQNDIDNSRSPLGA